MPLGEDYAHALAAKDHTRLSALLHPDLDFRAQTPNYNWRAQQRDDVLAIMLGDWFEESDDITIERFESDSFADRQRVGYRFRVETAEGEFLVEQQAFIGEQDGVIGWMRLVCSGRRPV
jgi:hypothetical protein